MTNIPLLDKQTIPPQTNDDMKSSNYITAIVSQIKDDRTNQTRQDKPNTIGHIKHDRTHKTRQDTQNTTGQTTI